MEWMGDSRTERRSIKQQECTTIGERIEGKEIDLRRKAKQRWKGERKETRDWSIETEQENLKKTIKTEEGS